MALLTKRSIAPLCKEIAATHPGWEYIAENFVNKTLKHSIFHIQPLWYSNIGAQPYVHLENKKATKLFREIWGKDYYGVKFYSVSRKIILRPDAVLETQVYRKVVKTLKEADDYIRDFFQRGINVINTYYPYKEEHELLEKMPIDLEGSLGIGYCLAKAVLHDFDFIRSYINDEIKTIAPKDLEIEDLKKILPIWEQRYQETGSIFL